MRSIRRPSRRDTLLANRAQLEGLAALTGRPAPEFLTRIPEKRGPRNQSGLPLERDVDDDIQRWARGQAGLVLWRNTRGEVLLPNGGRLRYGVGPNGASDRIGYKTITVTPGMVGKRIAVFAAVEVKRPGADPTGDQVLFIDRIRAAGGIAGVARSAEDAEGIVAQLWNDE